MRTSENDISLDSAVSLPRPPGINTLVRKSIPEEALVTGWSEISGTDQHVTTRWPHHHPFYAEGGHYSPLLFVESLRQALALLTHDVHHIPLTHRLGWERIRSTVNRDALHVGTHPAEVTLRISHPSVKRRRLGSVLLTSHIEARRAGQHLGSAELDYSAHPPALYDRLRGSKADADQVVARALPPAPPIPAHRAGRQHDRDVVLSPTSVADTWQLRVDPGHKVLFDHSHDHVPGMVLLEAAAQAAQAVVDHPVTAVAFATDFFRYVELDRPCLVSAGPAEPGTSGDPDGSRIHVTASQDDHPVFSSHVVAVPRRA
ncbi:ScbA/BarX family gamma-butyrolactone biosynthesis protein [Streptomyces sp. SYP-A7185]|uniref:ScbA/BarX family gamma-butyrolactone biosynthesis protein n=1 Tax=Streptomyces sp. SYP-A7185 TaxID=3040076 RepID=UPI0038F77F14